MDKQSILSFLCLLFFTSALADIVALDPRGARPIEHGHKASKCATEKEWPFCTDDDWGPKCPSGCRVQGLLDKYDHQLLKKIEKIRSLLEQNEANYRSTDHTSKQTYDALRDKLTSDAGNADSYYDLAQNLRQRIVEMKIKIDRQLRALQGLKDRVRDQVIDMQRMEVDIDIKLRSCKGSCQSYSEFSVDHDSYIALDKQINQLESNAAQSVNMVGSMYVMKSRNLRDAVVDNRFKSRDLDTMTTTAEQRQEFFPNLETKQLFIESEGSSVSSPATVSKVSGTSFSSSSSSSASSKSITDLKGGLGGGDSFGGLEGGFETTTVSCTKGVKTTIVQTNNGPVERTEEVTGGGPDCQLVGASKGGLSDFFPSLGSTKGALGDTKGFGDPFAMDFGGFMTDATDDDVPDIQARSVKSARVERQAGYEGKGTPDLE